MFNGIITSFYKIFFLKYFIKFNFFFFKFNKKFFDLNIGDSLAIQGVCLTLIYKSFLFFEFDFSYGTFLNISFFNKKYLNFEKSFYIFNNLNGHFLYGHINNLFFLKNKFFFFNIIKFYLIILKFLNKFFIYKLSLSLNGISLTINEIIFFKKFIFISFNILNFSFFFTNLKFLKIFDVLNIEFDIFIFFVLKFLFK